MAAIVLTAGLGQIGTIDLSMLMARTVVFLVRDAITLQRIAGVPVRVAVNYGPTFVFGGGAPLGGPGGFVGPDQIANFDAVTDGSGQVNFTMPIGRPFQRYVNSTGNVNALYASVQGNFDPLTVTQTFPTVYLNPLAWPRQMVTVTLINSVTLAPVVGFLVTWTSNDPNNPDTSQARTDADGEVTFQAKINVPYSLTEPAPGTQYQSANLTLAGAGILVVPVPN